MPDQNEAREILIKAGLKEPTPVASGLQSHAFSVIDAEGQRRFAKVAKDSEASHDLRVEGALLRILESEWDRSHPGIPEPPFARVRDSRNDYLVLEWIDGESLLTRLAPTSVYHPYPKLTCAEATSHAGGLLTFLEWMHGLGVFHCDLGPHNIRVDAELRWRVIDFGKARNLRSSSPPRGKVYADTAEGEKNIYLAPEWFGPSPPRPDDAAALTRRDLYALGATVHEALVPTWAAQQRDRKSPDERDMAVGEQLRGKPLGNFINAVCAAEPDSRPASAAAAAALLDGGDIRDPSAGRSAPAADDSGPAVDHADSGPPRSSGGLGQWVPWVILCVVVVIVLVGALGITGLGGWFWFGPSSPPPGPAPGLGLPEEVRVEQAVLGRPKEVEFTVENPSRTVREVEISAPAGWSAPGSVALGAAGRAVVTLRYEPDGYSDTTGTLDLREGEAQWTVALRGSTDPDADDDGHRARGAGHGDCNDDDASVHPGASDAPGDGVDQDCSGADAVRLPNPPPAPPGDGSGAGNVPATVPATKDTSKKARPPDAAITTVTVIGDVPPLSAQFRADPKAFAKASHARRQDPASWTATGIGEADKLASLCVAHFQGRLLDAADCDIISACAIESRPNDDLQVLCRRCSSITSLQDIPGCGKISGIPPAALGNL